jgi:hypothetical protein
VNEIFTLHVLARLSPGRGAIRVTGEATLDNKNFIIEIRSKADFLAEVRADLSLIGAGKKEEEPVERVFFESIDAANRLLTPKRRPFRVLQSCKV